MLVAVPVGFHNLKNNNESQGLMELPTDFFLGGVEILWHIRLRIIDKVQSLQHLDN